LIVATALANVASLWGSLQRASGATERLFSIVDTVPDIRDPEDPIPVPAGGGRVELDEVSFAYPGRPDETVLDRISFTIAPGEAIAVVGPSGAGKTTLTALLCRFFDPDQGSVRFEGIDVRRFRLAELRRQMAIVAQEPVLFSGTIRDNIGYGRAGATDDEIVAAAQSANAHDFVESFPTGYDTLCGERGVQLSGGQKQRIAIARALLADPRLLILDEATSSLDSESEAAVQEALAALMRERTTLVIAHRLSTVRDADRILVLDGGRLVEEGDHDHLIAAGGLYARLVERQLQ
jgi:ATP-binding cassette subfamily B protein